MAHIQKSKTVSLPNREHIISQWHKGESFKNIASCLGLSNRTVSKIVTNAIERGHLLALKPGGKERHIANQNVVEHIEYEKISKPSTSVAELQAGLLRDGVCNVEKLPAESTIGDIVRKDLGYTYKKLHLIPEESLTEANQIRTLNYIMQMSELNPNKIHFFDECSVKRTTGNCSRGHELKGMPAFEVKRYASDCNYTVNLLQSRFGISNFGILEGASKWV